MPRSLEERFNLHVLQPIDEVRLAYGRLAALSRDLPCNPLEVLARLLRLWQNVDRVLDRDRAEPLQTPPDLGAKVRRLRGDLVNEEQPPRFLRCPSLHRAMKYHSCMIVTDRH